MSVIKFPNASRRRRPYRSRNCDPGSASDSQRGPNMQTLLFRSSRLIVESDDADLVRDVGLALDRAQTKLGRVKRRLKDVKEQAAAQVLLLTTAETKLTAAIVAALMTRSKSND
jgi:hypothetical protein